jgi:hypothetical protein
MTPAERAVKALAYALIANLVLPLTEADQVTKHALQLAGRVK